ncbi:MAG: hypothetical protein IIT78_03220 [Mycoplasmataceae bacterium]|nr:hypothetical protein [Mycoplasmataceae bacterium]
MVKNFLYFCLSYHFVELVTVLYFAYSIHRFFTIIDSYRLNSSIHSFGFNCLDTNAP